MFTKLDDMVKIVFKTKERNRSVLSSFFGKGMSRREIPLAEIVNKVFSRNNSILVGNSTSANMDWKLGDERRIFGAISTGGSILVTNNDRKVTMTTGLLNDKEPKKQQSERKQRYEI